MLDANAIDNLWAAHAQPENVAADMAFADVVAESQEVQRVAKSGHAYGYEIVAIVGFVLGYAVRQEEQAVAELERLIKIGE